MQPAHRQEQAPPEPGAAGGSVARPATWHDRAKIGELVDKVKQIDARDRVGMGYTMAADGKIRFCLEAEANKNGCSANKLAKKWDGLREILAQDRYRPPHVIEEDKLYGDKDPKPFLCSACGVWAVKTRKNAHKKKCVANPECEGVLAAAKRPRVAAAAAATSIKKPRVAAAAAAAAALPQQQQQQQQQQGQQRGQQQRPPGQGPGPMTKERWATLTPEQKTQYQAMVQQQRQQQQPMTQERWAKMTPQEQKQFQQRRMLSQPMTKERWEKMTPEQQQQYRTLQAQQQAQQQQRRMQQAQQQAVNDATQEAQQGQEQQQFQQQSGGGSAPSGRTGQELVPAQLDRLRSEIREELKREELKRKDSVERYLTGEMASQTCSICMDLMVSPRTPMMLFPCGHTFCSLCIERNLAKGGAGKNKCPHCRAAIKSKAPNLMLQKLVQGYVEQQSAPNVGHSRDSI